MKKQILALLCALIISSTIRADDTQTTPSPNKEHEELARYKAKDELDEANKQINSVWNATTKETRATLLPEQKQWLKKRENDCTQKATAEQTNNSIVQDTIKLHCMTAMTDPRTEELKQKIASINETQPIEQSKNNPPEEIKAQRVQETINARHTLHPNYAPEVLAFLDSVTRERAVRDPQSFLLPQADQEAIDSKAAKGKTHAFMEKVEPAQSEAIASTAEIQQTTPSATATPASTDDWQTIDRYQVKDGLVKDTQTGLMWMRCSIGQEWNGSTCEGEAKNLTWHEAMKSFKKLNYQGYSGWHIPTIKELKTLVYCSTGQPTQWNTTINETEYDGCLVNYDSPTVIKDVFPATPTTWLWTSSSNAADDKKAWVVNFGKGSSPHNGNKDGAIPVRLVRSQ